MQRRFLFSVAPVKILSVYFVSSAEFGAHSGVFEVLTSGKSLARTGSEKGDQPPWEAASR